MFVTSKTKLIMLVSMEFLGNSQTEKFYRKVRANGIGFRLFLSLSPTITGYAICFGGPIRSLNNLNYVHDKNAFQWDPDRPLQWSSLWRGRGGVCPEECLPTVSAWRGVCPEGCLPGGYTSLDPEADSPPGPRGRHPDPEADTPLL